MTVEKMGLLPCLVARLGTKGNAQQVEYLAERLAERLGE